MANEYLDQLFGLAGPGGRRHRRHGRPGRGDCARGWPGPGPRWSWPAASQERGRSASASHSSHRRHRRSFMPVEVSHAYSQCEALLLRRHLAQSWVRRHPDQGPGQRGECSMSTSRTMTGTTSWRTISPAVHLGLSNFWRRRSRSGRGGDLNIASVTADKPAVARLRLFGLQSRGRGT